MRMTSPDAPQHPQANLEPQQPAKKTPSKGAKTVGLIAAAAVALCCIGGVVAAFNTDSGRQGISDGSNGAPADRSLEATAMCETFVKQQLKAPATAKFSEENTTKVSDVEYSTTGAVDAQNSFGALIRNHFTCDITVDTAANKWTSKSVNVTQG